LINIDVVLFSFVFASLIHDGDTSHVSSTALSPTGHVAVVVDHIFESASKRVQAVAVAEQNWTNDRWLGDSYARLINVTLSALAPSASASVSAPALAPSASTGQGQGSLVTLEDDHLMGWKCAAIDVL
jgi:two-component sensor histidine kinase